MAQGQQVSLSNKNMMELLTNGFLQLSFRTGFEKIGQETNVTVNSGTAHCECTMTKIGSGLVKLVRSD